MQEAWTLGNGLKKRRFVYTGSVATGVHVLFRRSTMRVSAGFFRALVSHFAGTTVKGGFSQTEPAPGGLGEWVAQYSRMLNETILTPRHASFLAAVLVHEGCAASTLEGNAIFLSFPSIPLGQESLSMLRLLPNDQR